MTYSLPMHLRVEREALFGVLFVPNSCPRSKGKLELQPQASRNDSQSKDRFAIYPLKISRNLLLCASARSFLIA